MQIEERIVEEYKNMLESRISSGATEKLLGWEKPHAKTVAWSYGMESHAKKRVDIFCELVNKKVDQLYIRSLLGALTAITSKRKN